MLPLVLLLSAAPALKPPPPTPSVVQQLTRSVVLRSSAAVAAAAAATAARAVPPLELLQEAEKQQQQAAGQPKVLYTPPSIKGSSTPEQLALAKHLERTGAKFYGAYWCRYCALQRSMFGASGARALPYVECAEDGYGAVRCPPQVDGYPSWYIDGKFYGGAKTLGQLQALSGFDSSVTFPAPPPPPPRPAAPPGGFKPPAVAEASNAEQLALAQHLQSSGAKFYGAYWCRYCALQRTLFGAEATAALPYVECAADGFGAQKCPPQVDGFPSWEVGGKFYSGYRPLDELARLSGFTPKAAVAVAAADKGPAPAAAAAAKPEKAKVDDLGIDFSTGAPVVRSGDDCDLPSGDCK